jgi:hypothetical protein
LVHSVCSIVVLALAGYELAFVVFSAVAFAVVAALVLLFSGPRESAYDQIGRGGIAREQEYAPRTAPAPDSPAARAEREQEIRQMLSARSERRVRSGQPALDIDAEIARLLASERTPQAPDTALVEEVRQIVVARNERRVRQGLQPLDVDAEVTRTLAELGP